MMYELPISRRFSLHLLLLLCSLILALPSRAALAQTPDEQPAPAPPMLYLPLINGAEASPAAEAGEAVEAVEAARHQKPSPPASSS
jgi:hypothetical protein